MTDAHPADPAALSSGVEQQLTLSQEIVTVGTEWTESGRIRLRRRIITETRTFEVTVRREELVIDTHNVRSHDGVMCGTGYDGPRKATPTAQPPIRIVLQEEVPEVALRLTPYELVTVTTSLQGREVQINEPSQHEELDIEQQSHTAG